MQLFGQGREIRLRETMPKNNYINYILFCQCDTFQTIIKQIVIVMPVVNFLSRVMME